MGSWPSPVPARRSWRWLGGPGMVLVLPAWWARPSLRGSLHRVLRSRFLETGGSKAPWTRAAEGGASQSLARRWVWRAGRVRSLCWIGFRTDLSAIGLDTVSAETAPLPEPHSVVPELELDVGPRGALPRPCAQVGGTALTLLLGLCTVFTTAQRAPFPKLNFYPGPDWSILTPTRRPCTGTPK